MTEQEPQPLPESAVWRLPKRKSPLFLAGRLLAAVCIFACVLFPKGGLTVYDIPVTWGYFLLGVATLLVMVHIVLTRTSLPGQYIVSYLLTLPFGLVVISSLLLNGWEQTGYALALITNAFVLPPIFLLIFAGFFNRSADIPFVLRMVGIAAVAAACYGIFLFVYKQSTGDFIEIPFLTTNGGQEETLDQRHNARGQIFKLVSTYNNGNIYGVCTLMLLPLLVPAGILRRFQAFPYVAVFLTLSRTAWMGLSLMALFRLVGSRRNMAGKILVVTFGLLAMVGAVSVYLHYSSQNWDWVFDSSLGDRIGQVKSVSDVDRIHFLPEDRFSTITEMTYINMLNHFGVLGLLAYLVAMAGPLLVAFRVKRKREGDYTLQNAAMQGVVIYLIVSFIDGAYLLIPVMAFYWFLMALALRREAVQGSGT